MMRNAQHELEAAVAGLELMGYAGHEGYRIYRFLACGHLQEIHTGHVRGRHIKCRTCLRSKHEAEASAAGYTLVGPARNGSCIYRSYRCNVCGTERDYQVSSIRRSSARCWVCRPPSEGGG